MHPTSQFPNTFIVNYYKILPNQIWPWVHGGMLTTNTSKKLVIDRLCSNWKLPIIQGSDGTIYPMWIPIL